MDDSTPKPVRRARYRGKNPRSFDARYKELHPEAYPDEINKIVAKGRTPVGSHRPIMVAEILDGLAIVPGSTVLDCTLGFGGHATTMIAACQPGGRFFGIDTDPLEIERTEARLRTLSVPPDAICLRRMNFAGAAQFIAEQQLSGVDAMLIDLGVSSMQLDDPQRGFSYKFDGPLDMRMNPNKGLSAAAWLSLTTATELERVLNEYSDEPNAASLSKAILSVHSKRPITTTKELAVVIASIQHADSNGGTEGAMRRVFQAIRIQVNEELKSLDTVLNQLESCLNPGGRIAILSFHSGEDRRVKTCFKNGKQSGLFERISENYVAASNAEIQNNSRARSAKLRIATRHR